MAGAAHRARPFAGAMYKVLSVGERSLHTAILFSDRVPSSMIEVQVGVNHYIHLFRSYPGGVKALQ